MVLECFQSPVFSSGSSRVALVLYIMMIVSSSSPDAALSSPVEVPLPLSGERSIMPLNGESNRRSSLRRRLGSGVTNGIGATVGAASSVVPFLLSSLFIRWCRKVDQVLLRAVIIMTPHGIILASFLTYVVYLLTFHVSLTTLFVASFCKLRLW